MSLSIARGREWVAEHAHMCGAVGRARLTKIESRQHELLQLDVLATCLRGSTQCTMCEPLPPWNCKSIIGIAEDLLLGGYSLMAESSGGVRMSRGPARARQDSATRRRNIYFLDSAP